MTEQGKIIKVKKGEAIVRVNRKSACAGCGMCAFKPSDLYVDIMLENTLNAKVGDDVEVEVTAGSVAKMSLISYLFPLFFGVLMLVLGFLLALPEWVDALMFFAGTTVGFVVVAVIDKAVYRRAENMPKMLCFVEKLQPTESSSSDKDIIES